MVKKNEIRLSVKGFVSIGTELKLREYIDILKKYGFNPLYYGIDERDRNKFETEKFIKFCLTEAKVSPFLKDKNVYTTIGWHGKKPFVAGVTFTYTEKFGFETILNFAKDLYYWFDAVYAYACKYKDMGKTYSPGHNIEDCLGGIVWANLFGKPYVDLWGKEKITNAPVHKIEWLDDGGVMMVLTESPFAEQEEIDRKELELKKYLGEKCFFSKKSIRQTITKEELIQQMLTPEPKNDYIAPDFSKYYDTKSNIDISKIFKNKI